MSQIFISYASQDYFDENGNIIPNNVVLSIENALNEYGFDYWIDKEGISGMENWMEIISRTISQSQIVLVVLTRNSIDSTFVKKEVSLAISKNIKVLPIFVDVDNSDLRNGLDFAFADIHHINWNPNPQDAIEKILKSLNEIIQPDLLTQIIKQIDERIDNLKKRNEQLQKYHDELEGQIKTEQEEYKRLGIAISMHEETCTLLKRRIKEITIEVDNEQEKLNKNKEKLVRADADKKENTLDTDDLGVTNKGANSVADAPKIDNPEQIKGNIESPKSVENTNIDSNDSDTTSFKPTGTTTEVEQPPKMDNKSTEEGNTTISFGQPSVQSIRKFFNKAPKQEEPENNN